MDDYETRISDRLRDAAHAPTGVDADHLWRSGRARRRRRVFVQGVVGVLLLIAAGGTIWRIGLADRDDVRDEPIGSQSCLTSPATPESVSVVYLVCDGTEVMPVERTTVPATPEAAVEALVAGPSKDEEDRGFSSPFVGLTADVSTVSDGLYVDLQGDPTLIRKAGGLAHLALMRTVFGFETIRTLSVTLNGSCENWTDATGSPCAAEAPGRTPPPDAPTECRGEPGDPAACTESAHPS